MKQASLLFAKLKVRTKLMLSILFAAAVFVGMFGLLYTTYYDRFVVVRRSGQLQRAFFRLQTEYSGAIPLDKGALEMLEYEYGLRLLILSGMGGGVYQVKYTSLVNNTRTVGRSLFFGNPVRSFIDFLPHTFGDKISIDILSQSKDARFDYVLFNVNEAQTGVGFIGLMGTHNPTKDIILLQLPTPIVQSATEITHGFLLLAGSLSLLASLVISWVLSRSLSRPIVEINHIAERMSELDFTHHYSGQAHDEIGELGSSINKLSAHLQRTIFELTEANNLLEEEVQRARELDEMRKNLLINVSHELKTPLALVQGYAEGLRINLNSDDESRSFYCGVIEDEARHMTRLVGDLLSVSRIEAGAVLPEREVFSIDELVCECLARLSSAAEANGLTLEAHPIGADVYADRDMIERALLNYLFNAIDHTSTGGKVCLSGQVLDDERARVFVFNSGARIEEEELPRIWQSFYKLDRARTRALGGTGIGLSIVKAIMEAHQCEYGAFNDESESGVVFWLELSLSQHQKEAFGTIA